MIEDWAEGWRILQEWGVQEYYPRKRGSLNVEKDFLISQKEAENKELLESSQPSERFRSQEEPIFKQCEILSYNMAIFLDLQGDLCLKTLGDLVSNSVLKKDSTKSSLPAHRILSEIACFSIAPCHRKIGAISVSRKKLYLLDWKESTLKLTQNSVFYDDCLSKALKMTYLEGQKIKVEIEGLKEPIFVGRQKEPPKASLKEDSEWRVLLLGDLKEQKAEKTEQKEKIEAESGGIEGGAQEEMLKTHKIENDFDSSIYKSLEEGVPLQTLIQTQKIPGLAIIMKVRL